MPCILIADDEAAMREQLADALHAAWPEADIVAQAVHGADASDQWLEHQPDACFLDIRMPGLTGLEVAQKIEGRCPVVFVTAYGDHALQAFDLSAQLLHRLLQLSLSHVGGSPQVGQTFADGTRNFGQLIGTDEQQQHQHDHNQLCATDPEHARLAVARPRHARPVA